MTYDQQLERLIKVSDSHPLLSENFVPWHLELQESNIYLSESLVSLYGMPEYETLSQLQKTNLGRYEVAQVMYSYAFGESVLCLFLSRFILSLQTNSLEYKYILKVLIEECRHQEMFSKALQHIDVEPLPIAKFQKSLGTFFAKFMSINQAFLSSLTIEMIADIYGDILRKDKKVYKVIQKISELHNIEEARHILYTKLFLEKRIANAGFIKRCSYSYTVLFSVWFMRSMYVKKEIYKKLNIPNENVLYKKAVKDYKQKFASQCLTDLVPFVKSINGFNWATIWLWKLIVKVKL